MGREKSRGAETGGDLPYQLAPFNMVDGEIHSLVCLCGWAFVSTSLASCPCSSDGASLRWA